MSWRRDAVFRTLTIGIGATAILDLWGIGAHRLFDMRLPNYGLVGRWFAGMAEGRVRHASIAASASFPNELAIGWMAHYAIGVALAALVLAVWGLAWARRPRIVPALIVGVGSVAAPLLLMQPGMGAGIASTLTSDPVMACLRSLLTHSVFGVGLYVAARLAAVLMPRVGGES